ncbi:MAG: glycoside hydrolase family 2 TIM barrel-domain containing protein [Verrucomicrobiota bacterium JB023]|nr:glycoside hydrolase family 2 TIM barrel-domain containing protein [Verrucomicrobiota bacterium JB023]
MNLDSGWQFQLSQDPPAAGDWEKVTIPHDWSWEAGPRKGGAQAGGGGFRIGGIGWYQTEFELPDSFAGQRVLLHFDGAFRNATVFLNEHEYETQPYGYLSFTHDVTEQLTKGRNELRVRLDCSQEPASRWYHPCGIYAPVHLEATAADSYLVQDGIAITTPEVSEEEATVKFASEIKGAEGHQLRIRIHDPAGKSVATSQRDASALTQSTLTVSRPALWSPDTPALYTATVALEKGGKIVDEVSLPFGIRSIKWEAKTGFHLNGVPTKLRGVCEHLTGGPVGGAWTEELLEWKLKKLKAMGCNAIRTAHNPQVPAFYHLCDRLGIMVMDEIFDGWLRKAPKDYGALYFDEWWQRDLATWVRRDRNHPSIVIWSVGNETHGKVAPDLVAAVHEHDETRPVTSGASGREHMDVIGINGASEKKSFFETGPLDRPFVATEATHTWQVRGFYKSRTWYRDGFPNKRQDPFLIPDLTEREIFHQALMAREEMANRKQIFLSSYDNATVRVNARQHWEKVRDLPWIAGAFRWTGFDYPGEATYVHGGLPFHAFAGGTHDLAGFEKDLAFFYQSQWTSEPMVHLLPHWTHPQMEEGTLIPVHAYSNAEEVELFLNGQSLGIDKPGSKALEMQCEWMVPWQPGTLLAIARRGGQEVARHEFQTASAPQSLAVETDTTLPGHAIITVDTVDAQGVPYPYGENTLFASLEGEARLLSFENGNPADPSLPVAKERRAFMGKARLFLETGESHYDLLLGSILGERRQLTSDLVAIEVKRFQGAAEGDSSALTIRYTTDGSEPTLESELYESPFQVPAQCVVRAKVYEGESELLAMEESFGPDKGLHWGQPDSSGDTGSPTALQAETADFEAAQVATNGQGYHGEGYLDFKGKQDTIEFYQENDGPPGKADLVIRYSHADPSGQRQLAVILNGKKVTTANFAATGSWDSDWKEITIPVQIQAGANHLQLKTLKKAGPNLDEVDFR